MADVTAAAPAPKRRKWLKIVGCIALTGLVLLLVLYFVVTSSAFFKSFVLPRAGKAMNANITVGDAAISPFSSVVLHQVKVQTTGTEPLLTASEVRLVYNLRDILGGNYRVDELTVTAPVVQIIKNADGTSNLDPLLKGNQKPAQKTPEPAKTSPPPQIDIKKIAFNNATIRMLETLTNGAHNLTELSGVNIALSDLKNGQTGKLTLAADLKQESHVPAPGTNSLLQAKATGSFSLGLTADLKPSSVTGNARVDVLKSEGAATDLAGLAAILDCDLTPTVLKQLALRFQKGGNNLGELRVSGPFDLSKTEGRLQVELNSIDRQVLSLVGSKSGIDFGTTTINSTNQVELATGGSVITVTGGLNIANMALTRQGQTTPAVNVRSDYNVTVNRTGNTALLRNLVLNGTANQQPFLRAELTSPMTIGWGGAAGGAPDSALRLSLTNFNLAPWKSFLGGTVSEGLLNVNATLNSQQAGKKLAFDLATTIDGLAAQSGTNAINQAKVGLSLRGEATDLDKLNLADFHADLSRQNQSLVTLAGSGQVELKAQNADLQISLNTSLPRLLELAPQPNVKSASGTLQVKAHITRQGQNQSVTGNLALTDLTGQFAAYQLAGFGITSDLDVAMNAQQMQIRKASGELKQGTLPGGKFEMTGDYDLTKKAGTFTAKLTDVNENTLRPFLAAALGDKKLVTANINLTSTTHIDPAGETSSKTDFQLGNLVVNDPKQQLPATPLQAKLHVDASWQKQVATVREFQINLTPTARATNQLNLTGQVDLSQTNVFQGSLKLAAQSLDVTPYYDLFANKPQAKPGAPATATAKPAPPTTPAPAANTEPAAITLPLRNFSLDLNVGRFYLRDMAITNLLTTAKIDGNKVLVKPLQLTLNGAPVNATLDLNLGMPGYQYSINFSADRIPVEPLLSSFSSQHTVATKGFLIANAQIQGAGVTGASLKKTLAGQASFAFTNAEINVQYNPYAKAILPYIATLLRLNELATEPLNYVNGNLKLGAGTIDITQFSAVADAYEATTQGQISIADVLGNSTLNNLPLTIAISRNLAQKSRLMPENTPTNAAYVNLPVFAHLTGTVDATKVKEDRLVLGVILAQTVYGATGGRAVDLIQSVGNLLTGQAPAATNAVPGTNTTPAATNKPSPLNLFDSLRKALPK